MIENFSSQIVFSIVCFSLGLVTVYRAILLFLKSQRARNHKPPHFPLRLVPGIQLPSLRQMIHQASKIISVVSFAIITAAVLMILLGYMPLSF